jgi:hypothetical protein
MNKKVLSSSNSMSMVGGNMTESGSADLLKRSEKVFNAQSAAQKMKIFNEMEQFI